MFNDIYMLNQTTETIDKCINFQQKKKNYSPFGTNIS